MRKRFDRTMQAGLAGVWVALALSGCANLGQQNAQNGAAADTIAAFGALDILDYRRTYDECVALAKEALEG